jgi:hypothetical protein
MALLEGGVEEWMEVRPRTLAHKSLCGSGVLSGFEVVLYSSSPLYHRTPFAISDGPDRAWTHPDTPPTQDGHDLPKPGR